MITEEGWGKGWIVREFGSTCTHYIYFKWIINKDLLYNTGNSAQGDAAVWMGGKFGGEWMHVRVCVYIYG